MIWEEVEKRREVDVQDITKAPHSEAPVFVNEGKEGNGRETEVVKERKRGQSRRRKRD